MPKPYENREIDSKFTALGEKVESAQNNLELRIGDNHKVVSDSLSRIEAQVEFTNGKVKKITMALIGMGGVVLGLGFTQLLPYLAMLAV